MNQYQCNLMVVKCNCLIESSSILSLFEQRIVLYVLSLINKEDEDFQQYTIDIREFRELVGIKQGYNYQDIKEVLKELLKKVVEIRATSNDPNKQYILTHWLSSAEVDIDRGTILVSIDPKLKPYLLKLKSHFTRYKLKYAIRFTNKYSVRVYELLQQHSGYGFRKLDIVKLKYLLGIPPEKYIEYKNFKAKVLLPVQKEINDTSDINFDFEEIKQRKKVAVIKFNINSIHKDVDSLLNVFLKSVPEVHQWKQSVKDILNNYIEDGRYNQEYITRNIMYANKFCKNNYPRYLSLALEEDWGLVDWENQVQKNRELEKKNRLREKINEEIKVKDEEEQERGEKILSLFHSLTPDKKQSIVEIAESKFRFLKNSTQEVKVVLVYEKYSKMFIQ